jgi:ABC-type glycerol-3-phosphate transport system permease component
MQYSTTANDRDARTGLRVFSEMWKSDRFQDGLLKGFLYVILSVLAFLFLVPLLWVISSSLKYPAQVYSVPIRWIPEPVQWFNYLDVFSLVPFARYGLNSLIVAGLATCGAVASSSVVAYSLSRLRWPGRNLVFMMVLGTMMLPPVVTLVPTFVIMTKLRWLDTFYPLIVPSWFGANAFYIFLMRQFMLGIPLELDEAARIDGAGSLRILFQLILPLSKPVVATVVIFSFLERYNDLLGPAMYLTTERKFTLSMGLYALSGTYGNYWPYVMAASVLMTVPIIVLFVIFQRQFIQGIQMTGLTGR